MRLIFNKSLALLCLCLGLIQSVVAQPKVKQVYHLQLGAFVDPKPKDFKSIRGVGYLYATLTDRGLTRVIVGDYDEAGPANSALAKIKAKGFKEAYLIKETLIAEGDIFTIQLASYNINETIYWADWQRLSTDLLIEARNNSLKICTGQYKTEVDAIAALEAMTYNGPKDIFIRKVNKGYLHSLTAFEMGMESGAVNNTISRESVLELQKHLKTEGFYTGEISGKNDAATQTAWTAWVSNNSKYQQYQQLMQNTEAAQSNEASVSVQTYINQIDEDPVAAYAGLNTLLSPIADAYLAYLYFTRGIVTEDRQAKTDVKLNSAIAAAYSKPNENKTFTSLQEILDGLALVQATQKGKVEIPCWLLRKHPNETQQAFSLGSEMSKDLFSISADCGDFLDWQELRTLQSIARDLDPVAEKDKGNLKLAVLKNYENSRRTLFASPQVLSVADANAAEQWHNLLWAKLKAWAGTDAYKLKSYNLLKGAYLHAQVLLENHFMNSDFALRDARPLALKVLQTIVAYHLHGYYDDWKK